MEYVSTTVAIPADRQADFHALFSAWLREGQEPGREQQGPKEPAPERRYGKAKPNPYTARRRRSLEQQSRLVTYQDLLSATEVDADALYRMISAGARAVLMHWAQRPDQWVSGSETAAALGLKGAKGVAGTLSSVGKAATKLGCELPFDYEAGEPGSSGRYRVSASKAAWFLNAASASLSL